MKATVLICTHDRAALLERTLRYLNEAERPANHEIEILVAANACSDGTLELLHGYQAEPDLLPLRWIEVATPGKSHALNQAIPLLESELTIFVDDDHRTDSRFLCEALRAAECHPRIDLFCGRSLAAFGLRRSDSQAGPRGSIGVPGAHRAADAGKGGQSFGCAHGYPVSDGSTA